MVLPQTPLHPGKPENPGDLGKAPRSSKPNGAQHLTSHTLRPRWAYIRLELLVSNALPHNASTPATTVTITAATANSSVAHTPIQYRKITSVATDFATAHSLLNSALTQYLGLSGSALLHEVDFLDEPIVTAGLPELELGSADTISASVDTRTDPRKSSTDHPGILIRIPWTHRREFLGALANWVGVGIGPNGSQWTKSWRVRWTDGWVARGGVSFQGEVAMNEW